jgi:hypothetical protein
MDNFNNFTISDSTNREDYEILIKEKKDNSVMAYCPQINLLIKHNDFEGIYLMMDNLIEEHIHAISIDELDDINLTDEDIKDENRLDTEENLEQIIENINEDDFS